MFNVSKTKLFVSLSFLLITNLLQSQDMVFGHADFIHSKGFDKVSDMHIDKQDNLYITGTFEKAGNIGAISVKQAGENTLFVAKYNIDGYIQYTKQLGGEGRLAVHSMTSDSENNLYLTGTFRKTCVIGKVELSSSDFQDNFIVKLSPEGDFLWEKQFKADTKEDKQVLICDENDDLIIGGSFYKTLQIDHKEVNSSKNSDLYLALLDKTGELKSLISFEGQGKEKLKDFTLAENNRLFIAGSFTETLNLGGNILKSNGRKDVFWAEISMNETESPIVKQAKQLGGRYEDDASKIFSIDNSLYLVGSFQDKLHFKTDDILSKGVRDVFVCRYKLNGREIDAVGIGGIGNDYPHAVVINKKGSLYIIGNYRGSIEFEDKQIETKEHQSDNFVLKLDQDLMIKNIVSFGGEDNDFPVDAVITNDNLIYVTGSFRNDFIFGETTSKLSDHHNLFLAALHDCENAELNLGDDIDACGDSYLLKPDIDFESYQWSNGSSDKNALISETGSYTLNVTDRFGCSTSDHIQVTLHDKPVIDLGEDVIIEKGNTISINAETGFISYQWTSSDMAETFEANREVLNINTQGLPMGEYSFNLSAIDQNGCTCEDQIKLTIVDKQTEPNINAFSAEIIPNPNDGRFTLYFNNVDPKRTLIYEIYSPEGKLLLKKSTYVLREQINMQKKAGGSYLLKILNGDKQIQKTIIITK